MWDLLEGHKNPAPLLWSWFGAVKMERKPLTYEESHRLLKFHTHSLARPSSYFYEQLPLPPEDTEEPMLDKNNRDDKADTPSSVESPAGAGSGKKKSVKRPRKPKTTTPNPPMSNNQMPNQAMMMQQQQQQQHSQQMMNPQMNQQFNPNQQQQQMNNMMQGNMMMNPMNIGMNQNMNQTQMQMNQQMQQNMGQMQQNNPNMGQMNAMQYQQHQMNMNQQQQQQQQQNMGQMNMNINQMGTQNQQWNNYNNMQQQPQQPTPQQAPQQQQAVQGNQQFYNQGMGVVAPQSKTFLTQFLKLIKSLFKISESIRRSTSNVSIETSHLKYDSDASTTTQSQCSDEYSHANDADKQSTSATNTAAKTNANKSSNGWKTIKYECDESTRK